MEQDCCFLATNSYIRRRWKFYDLFDAAPGTSDWSTQEDRGTADEMHIVVYDSTGKISGYAEGVAGQRTLAVLEIYQHYLKIQMLKTARVEQTTMQNNLYTIF